MSRFGIRECCDVVLKPLQSVDFGGQHFDAYQPMVRFDTLKTSTLESTSSTVYAQGGRGNPRLIGWDGEKTLTLTFEDALLSPESFAMLSGAGLVHGRKQDKDNGFDSQKIFVHTTFDMVAEKLDDQIVVKLTDEDRNGARIIVSREAPIYPVTLDSAGAQAGYLSAVTENQVKVLDGDALVDVELSDQGEITNADGKTIVFILASETDLPGDPRQDSNLYVGDTVRIDCYEVHEDGAFELQVDADSFAGYYYLEASTLFRDEATGADMPAELVLPRIKIQTNWSITMAGSGDPSTFTFTCDCFPAFTKFNRSKKMMAVIQVIGNDDTSHNYRNKSIMGHEDRTKDSDVDTYYSKTIFNETGEDDPFVPSAGVKIGASLVSDSSIVLDGVALSDLVTGTLVENGTTFAVKGTIAKEDNWAAFPGESKRTSYYVPLELTGEKGDKVTSTTLIGTSKTNVFGETGDTDTTMVLVLAVDSSKPVRTFTVTRGDESTEYTLDCSGATFA